MKWGPAPDWDVASQITSSSWTEISLVAFIDDPAIGIDWPVTQDKAHLSAKGQNQPKLADLQENFVSARDL